MQEWAIGVDLGGTKIEVALVNADGQLLDRLRVPTESSHNSNKIIEDIANAIHQLFRKHSDTTPSIIGIGVAGQIEKNTGNIIFSPNLGWHHVNLQEQLTNKVNLPVVVCNDVKAAAWGEWLYGAGMHYQDLVCIFVGTGIGGGIVCNGKMLEGCGNTAGEIGHITIQLNGPLCHCGNKGCLEALAGGWAIERDAQRAVQNNMDHGKMLLEIAGGDITAITGATVAAAMQKRDKLAIQLLDNVVEALTAGITSVVNLIGPCRVILGGGVIEGILQLVERVAKGVKKNALKAAMVSVDIVPAKLHNDSGVIGAAAFALHQHKTVIYDH